MQLPVATLLTAALAATGVSASPTPQDTSPNPLAKRQGNWWAREECFATVKGNVIGGSTLWMLRNTWNNHFRGDFGGSGTNGYKKGICCWGQCLWVDIRGDRRSWNGDQWGDALGKLTNLVGGSKRGLCGVRIADDPYLILMSSQHDAVTFSNGNPGQVWGDTCRGNPPW